MLVRCAIWGNAAEKTGGALVCFAGSKPVLTACTIAGNFAPDGGGGVRCYSSSWRIEGSILWGNEGGSLLALDDGNERVLFSAVEGESLWPGQGNSKADPLFRSEGVFDVGRFAPVEIGGKEHPLPDFVVEPPDYHLLSGSPAIDAGSCFLSAGRDIEGAPRPQGAGCDMGAYEFTPPPPAIRLIRGDANEDARVDVSDAVFLLRHLYQGSAAPPCELAGDSEDDGDLDQADAVRILNHLFLGGPPPAAPYPDCGPMSQTAALALGCATPPVHCR